MEIFYTSGRFDTDINAQYSTGAMHAINITINLYVSAKAKGDLDTLNNPSATPAEKQAALAAFVMASKQAHLSLNELFRIIYLILMDGNNIDLGLPTGTISDRWIANFTKNAPATQGELFLLTGTFTYNCKAYEDFTGATPVPSISIDTVIDIEDDDVEKTGVEIDSN